MKPDILLDAMEYIDDDLLKAVEKLRTGGKRHNSAWMRWASLAACVCILAGGVLVWSRLYSRSVETEGVTGSPETMATPTGDEETIQETGTIAETECAEDGGTVEDAFMVPGTIDCSGLDVSGTKSVRLHSGITGEEVWLTDPADIQAITDCVVQIRAENPESSRGYYGWTYTIELYDAETPAEDAKPFWGGSMCCGSFGSMYLYETVNGHMYYAQYDMTGITTEEVDAVCEGFFPPLTEE